MNTIVNPVPVQAGMTAHTAVAPRWHHRASLSAVLVGAAVALTVGFALTALGTAIGTGLVDTVHRDTPSATSFTVGAGAWMLATHVVALFAGGIVAGRLSGGFGRDGALHGLGVWGVCTLFSAMALSSAVGSIGSTVGSAVGSAAGGATAAVGAATAGAASQINPREVVDRARAALSAPSDPARMNGDQRAAEITRIIGNRIAQGNLNDADRQRLNQLVAAEAGMTQEQADQRVRAYEADAQRVAQETERRAREAADATAKAASLAAWWFFATMLLGGIFAWFGGARGAEELWREDGVTAH